MKVELLEPFRSFLLRAPCYASVFMTVREWSEPVLVMRVEELSSFQQGEYRTHVSVRAWRDRQGTWVVAVPFQIIAANGCVQGMPCLNPRHAVDYEVIRKFAKEESLRFVFLRADLEDADEVQVPWPPAQRAHVQHLLAKIDLTLTGKKLTCVFDPDFEQARRKLTASIAVALRVEGEEQWRG